MESLKDEDVREGFVTLLVMLVEMSKDIMDAVSNGLDENHKGEKIPVDGEIMLKVVSTINSVVTPLVEKVNEALDEVGKGEE